MGSILCRSTIIAAALLGVFNGAAAQAVVSYEVDKPRLSIPSSLTGVPGNPEKGRAVAINRKKGNCLACHTLPILDKPFHGGIAPPLIGVGARYDVGQLRLRVVDPKIVNPMSIMPSFYKIAGLHRVAKSFQGRSILSAQEVEDVIAYLVTLK